MRAVVAIRVGVACAALAIDRARSQPSNEVLPMGPIQRLSLRAGEVPQPYALLPTNALPTDLQMATNPGYVGNRQEMETMAKYGGQGAFAALYGRPSEEPMIVLNGVFFRQPEHCEAFVDMQRGKERPIRAFTLQTESGTWVLLIARNPNTNLNAREVERFEQGFERYAKRLGLTPCYDGFRAGQSP